MLNVLHLQIMLLEWLLVCYVIDFYNHHKKLTIKMLNRIKETYYNLTSRFIDYNRTYNYASTNSITMLCN